MVNINGIPYDREPEPDRFDNADVYADLGDDPYADVPQTEPTAPVPVIERVTHIEPRDEDPWESIGHPKAPEPDETEERSARDLARFYQTNPDAFAPERVEPGMRLPGWGEVTSEFRELIVARHYAGLMAQKRFRSAAEFLKVARRRTSA